MQVIGEKINGTRKRVARAIAARDAEFIQDLARKQTEAGAVWLDVNAGTMPAREPDDLVWLIETIQAVIDTALCLDSANPTALEKGISVVNKTPMINSISGEPNRLADILPIVVTHGCPVIALAMDDKGIPRLPEDRMAVIREIMRMTREQGIEDGRIYIDPLAMTVSTNIQSANITLETMRLVRAEFPEAHLTLGLSNISFGLPARARINRTFMALAMQAGLDSAIIDPLDKEMRAVIVTMTTLLGRDRHCLNYTRAFRAGLLES
jgi:5-methyltetrahydrofolate--homocysteine methyltransferase